jgi:hypothetical protein
MFLFVGLRSLVNVYMRVRNCTERTEALVTGYEESYVTDTNSHTEQPTYAPVFTFYAGGRNVTAVSNVSRGSQKYDIGERVMIRYNPKDPKEISAPATTSSIFLWGSEVSRRLPRCLSSRNSDKKGECIWSMFLKPAA